MNNKKFVLVIGSKPDSKLPNIAVEKYIRLMELQKELKSILKFMEEKISLQFVVV